MGPGSSSGQNLNSIHILAKPVGPLCNLDCTYCFYLEKKELFPKKQNYTMSVEVLQSYITKYISLQPTSLVQFVWQGGEPTLAGLDFFKRAIKLQRHFAGRKQIKNSIQTNGTLLNDEWCEFFKENDFLVGISLDGPREIHDRYRTDHSGGGSFDHVLRGLRLLQKYGVEYNVMATVGKETAYRPLDIYHFFKEEGVEFIQFTPVIERVAGWHELQQGLKLAGLSTVDNEDCHQVTEWSVEPEAYGDFLIAIFDEWVRNDVGTTNVMNFEWALNSWLGISSPNCQHAQKCGTAILLEHNGDVYACDHCVYPECKLGNIVNDDPVAMVEKSICDGFGDKKSSLTQSCLECEVLMACWGGCPKHRFNKSYRGESAQYYLCQGNKKFFTYIRKYLHAITQLLENGLPASMIMKAIDGPLVIDKTRNRQGGSHE